VGLQSLKLIKSRWLIPVAWTTTTFLPRDATRTARYTYSMSSARPSVRLSVTLVDCDNIRWHSSKLISQI